MDSLTKEQKDDMATSFAVLALYDGDVSFNGMLCTTVKEARKTRMNVHLTKSLQLSHVNRINI